MSSKTKILGNSLRKARRRIRRSVDSRRCHSRSGAFGARKSANNGEAPSCFSDVAAKLEALESLIPTHNNGNGEVRQTEQLFKETADYIVLLKTQVAILQKLIEFFGSSRGERENAVVS